jgi:hypothetical protein
MIAVMVIPMAVSIMAIVQVKTLAVDTTVSHNVICFTPDNCAVEVNGIWYRIDGVIGMDATIPDDYIPEEHQPDDHVERIQPRIPFDIPIE